MTDTHEREHSDGPGPEVPGRDARLDQLEQDVQSYRVSRDAWTFIIFGLAALAALAAVIAIGIALNDDDGGAGAVEGAGAGDGAAAAGPPAGFQAVLTEFAIDLSHSQIDAGGVMQVVNDGTAVHNVTVRDTDLATPDLAGGESGELDLTGLAPGTYELFCSIPGHEQSGMVTTLVIGGEGEGEGAGGEGDGEGAAAPAAGTSGAGHDAHEMTPEEGAAQDQRMLDSIAAFPAETEGLGNQPLEPEILPDGTKRFELTAAITDWEVAPGEIVQAWTYNGTVPGPRIDLEVGDEVEVEITNELPLGTDIHWHGVDVPNDQDGVGGITQPLIASGETYTYNFTVTEPAAAMYHAHAHAHETVPNGLFGVLYVGDMPLPAGETISGIEIPADLEITQNFPMVLNDAGVIGLSLDGKSFPATAPVVAEAGEWLQVTYYNEGLQVHPMHLHGFEQIIIAKDGEPLDQPYAADTVLVGPGERYTAIFNADLAGTWVWHCHILNHAESDDGLFGMVTAVVVE